MESVLNAGRTPARPTVAGRLFLLLSLTASWAGCGSRESQQDQPSGPPAFSVDEHAQQSDQESFGTLSAPVEVVEVPPGQLSQVLPRVQAWLASGKPLVFHSSDLADPQDETNVDAEQDAEQDAELTGGVKLTLMPDQLAAVEYIGEQTETFEGTYRIDANDRLMVDFGPEDLWLPMRLTIQGDWLLINTPDREVVVRTAVEAGIEAEEITAEDLALAFQGWPLRCRINDDQSK